MFMQQGPDLQWSGPNSGRHGLLLEHATESTHEVCDILAVYLNHATTLPPDELPLEAQFTFIGDRMPMHPCGIAGSFEHVKCVDANRVILISHGVDDAGTQLVEPPALPAVPPVPIIPILPPNLPAGAPPNAPVVPPAKGVAPGPDPNAVLLQSMLVGINLMTQVNARSDQQNTQMAQQQMQLQAATL